MSQGRRGGGSASGRGDPAKPGRLAGRTAGLTGARAWALVDQGASSASNLLLVAIVARVSDVADFGHFSLVYLIYGLALGSMRAGGGDVLLLRAEERNQPIAQEARRLMGVAVWVGALVGVPVVGVTLASGASAAQVTVAFAAILPILLLQDALRYCFFALGTPRRAAASDLLWFVAQVSVTFLLFVLPGRPGPPVVVLAWGAGALASGTIGSIWVGLTPNIVGAASWLRNDRTRVGSFLGDFLLMSGSGYLAIYLIALVATVRAVAAVRGSAFLFAPLEALFLGIRIFVLPALARASASGEAAIRRVARLVGTVSAVITALATGVLLALPNNAGAALLGATWIVARPLIVFSGLAAAARFVALPAQAGLRALNDARRIVRLRLTVTALVPLAALIGSFAGGASGAVMGLALAFSADAIISWRAFVASCRQTYGPGVPANR